MASQKGATVYLRTLLGFPGQHGGAVDTAQVLKEIVQEAAWGGGGRQQGLLLGAALEEFQLALPPPHSPVTRWPVICHRTLPLVLPTPACLPRFPLRWPAPVAWTPSWAVFVNRPQVPCHFTALWRAVWQLGGP